MPEQGGGKLIPEGIGKPGHVYTVAHGSSRMIGVYKIETEVVSGSGKFEKLASAPAETPGSINTAFNYFKANKKNISGAISLQQNDFLMHVQDLRDRHDPGWPLQPLLPYARFFAEACAEPVGCAGFHEHWGHH